MTGSAATPRKIRIEIIPPRFLVTAAIGAAALHADVRPVDRRGYAARRIN